MPRREPQAPFTTTNETGQAYRHAWRVACLTDLREGKHARGCECSTKVVSVIRRGCPGMREWQHTEQRANACAEIVRCALEMEGYDVD